MPERPPVGWCFEIFRKTLKNFALKNPTLMIRATRSESTERQRDRETERQRDRETRERERDRETERQ